jgi:F-type H+-transporting ATPase subunit b
MEALGFDLKYFLFQLVNFTLLLVILKKLIHKPLLNLLEKRREEIEAGLKHAAAARKALTQTEEDQKAILENARSEARGLIEVTRQEAKALELSLTEDAAAKAAVLMENARMELSREKELLRQELRQELSALVVIATEKVMGEAITDAEKLKHVDKLVKEVA